MQLSGSATATHVHQGTDDLDDRSWDIDEANIHNGHHSASPHCNSPPPNDQQEMMSQTSFNTSSSSSSWIPEASRTASTHQSQDAQNLSSGEDIFCVSTSLCHLHHS
jgi:hypothetical protein